MKVIMKYMAVLILAVLSGTVMDAQVDRREVRSGNRQFKKGNW